MHLKSEYLSGRRLLPTLLCRQELLLAQSFLDCRQVPHRQKVGAEDPERTTGYHHVLARHAVDGMHLRGDQRELTLKMFTILC